MHKGACSLGSSAQQFYLRAVFVVKRLKERRCEGKKEGHRLARLIVL